MTNCNLASALGHRESGAVSEVEPLGSPDHDEDDGASDGPTRAGRAGLIEPLADVGKHVAAEHPNGSPGIAPVLTLGA